MAPAKNGFSTYVFLLTLLIITAFLYQRYQSKLDRENQYDDYTSIKKYLLNDPSLVKDNKPIMWIHIDYEYNSRNWLNFGSRSSFDLNQNYLYLTVKSIINHCGESFHICIVDDNSFAKLLPDWTADVSKVPNPSKCYLRELAMTTLLYNYGGMRVPNSFICMRDLIGLYGSGSKPFVCEVVDRNVTSTHFEFCPSISFMGAAAGSSTVLALLAFIRKKLAEDYTDETKFLGEYNRWAVMRISKGELKLVDGKMIGTKTIEGRPVLIDELLTNDYLDIYSNTYGIYIPGNEILKRRNYEWFVRLSPMQVLESNIIISKYLLLASAPGAKNGVIEPMRRRPNWVSFWSVPSQAPVWGLKPNLLGDNLRKLHHPSN